MHTARLLQAASGALITDPTWVFFLVLGIMLFAPLLLRRLHVPHIIGLILAGILVGQYGFNILERDSSFELFGEVGIYYIMFLAGLELNMGSVQRYGWQGLGFGLLTFLLPFALGFLSGRYILHYGVLTSLLLSCIYSSHTLVSYPIVGRYGLGRHRIVVVSVVATAFALFAALLTLALVVGSMNPDTSALTWVFFALKCAVYGAAVAYLYPRVGRWFLRRFDDSVLQYIFILALVFLSASLARLVGLDGLLGAFLAGLVLNRIIPRTSPLMNRVEFVGNALFIPYFLIGVGMIIDVRVLLSDVSTIRVVTVMVVTGALTKWIAAWLMARLSRAGTSGMWLMFGLTNAHAAGALAIVMVGTAPGVDLIDSAVLNGTVMLILFSCIVSSIATSHGARNLALSDTSLEDNRGSYHGKCLVAYTQADSVDVLTQYAILIRNPYIADSLMGLSVTFDNEEGDEEQRLGQQLLESAKKIAASADVQMATLSRVSNNISSGILHTLKEYDVGEVIFCLADRETGLPKASLGNVIEGVLGGSHREVMAIRALVPPGTLRQIVTAVPEKAEYEVGFYKWLEHLCRIGEQTDCRMDFRAHPATMWYIQNYMLQHHPRVRATFTPMPRWSDLQNLYDKMGPDKMLVLVSARPGFISHTDALDSLPQVIHQHFRETSVLLLYPDQWGDPMETVSVFSPNGTVVTRQPNTLGGWLRRRFLAIGCLLATCCLQASAQRPAIEKMSPMVRQAAMEAACTRQDAGVRKGPSARHGEARLCALVRTTDTAVLDEYGCRTLASWGDIHIADIPLHRLNALSRRPEVQRIEARKPCTALLDTSLIVTHVAELHVPADTETAYTGRGIVMGLMDVGFDLTHPTFYSRDLSNYRIKAFWDQLDTIRGEGDTLFVGRQFLTETDIRAKAHATDGLIQFHGTHTASTAAGSGYDSPYIGVAPEADLCLVANAVSSDAELIPEQDQYLYTSATDLLGFKYIYDYARGEGKPCVISFSEGSYQDLYGDDRLMFEVLDSLTGPGRLLCASAGNLGRYLTYLNKPKGLAETCSLLQFEPQDAYYTLRSDRMMSVRLTFYHTPQHVMAERTVSTRDILACPDSLLADTIRFEGKSYLLMMAAYPSCYNPDDWATELYLKSLEGTENRDYRVLLTLMGEDCTTEAFASGGHFTNSTDYPDFQHGEFSHSIHTPSSAPSVICVGSTSWRTATLNHAGQWQSFAYGSNGERTATSSTGPTLTGLTKPDVMAPGMHVIAAMSSYYLAHQKENWYTGYDVERFDFQGREYAWNAQSGTSMSCPIVGGILALWLEACPRLTREQAMEAIAATSRRLDPDMDCPNNEWGYGEINAEAGLQYVLSHFAGIEETEYEGLRPAAVYDLAGRRFSLDGVRNGIYLVRDGNGKVKKVKY